MQKSGGWFAAICLIFSRSWERERERVFAIFGQSRNDMNHVVLVQVNLSFFGTRVGPTEDDGTLFVVTRGQLRQPNPAPLWWSTIRWCGSQHWIENFLHISQLASLFILIHILPKWYKSSTLKSLICKSISFFIGLDPVCIGQSTHNLQWNILSFSRGFDKHNKNLAFLSILGFNGGSF